MQELNKKRVLIICITLLFIGAIPIITAMAKDAGAIRSSSTDLGAEAVVQVEKGETWAEEPTTSIPPPPKQDSCLHCHITGEDKNLWTPLARWFLFGTMGLFLGFGLYRNVSVWVNRTPWKPIPQRMVEWVDERYHVSEPLTKVLSKPVPKYALRWWYCLGGITAFLFVVQGTTGILLAFYYQPTPEAAYASIQYIESQVHFGAAIRAIHHWAANGMIVMCFAHMVRVFVSLGNELLGRRGEF